MKKMLSVCLIAGAMLGISLSANAVDFKAKGRWDFNFEWEQHKFLKDSGDNRFNPKQRLRTQIDIIASESLKGVVYFELGKTIWGRGADGASIGTDGRDVIKVRYSYVDWIIPYTDVQVRMGLQPYVLPGFVAGSTILDADGAGLTVSATFNEYIGASAFWMRALHHNYFSLNKHNQKVFKGTTLDVVGLAIPISVADMAKVTPWGLYGFVGKKSLFGEAKGDIEDLRSGLLPVIPGMETYAWGANNPFGVFPSKQHGNAWWAGLSAELTTPSPLHIAVDGAYGRADVGKFPIFYSQGFGVQKIDLKREGWYASLLAEYKLEYVTPGIIFWYASGDNDDIRKGSKRMPTIVGNWTATSFGYAGTYGIGRDSVLGNTIAGTWAGIVQLKDISFIENLSHVLRGGRIQGTNNKKVPEKTGMAFLSTIHDTRGGNNMIYLTKKDYAWEVDFDTEYKIYKDLSMALELSYLRLELDKKIWSQAGKKQFEKNAYRAGVNMKFAF